MRQNMVLIEVFFGDHICGHSHRRYERGGANRVKL